MGWCPCWVFLVSVCDVNLKPVHWGEPKPGCLALPGCALACGQTMCLVCSQGARGICAGEWVVSGGCNLNVDVGLIAYKANTKLGRDSIGANQNGARKHHFCALFLRLE